MPVSRSLSFLSPLAKLVRFFQRSRDAWKEKCKAAKRQNKSLKLCLAKMKESRDRWKAQAIAANGGKKSSRPDGRKHRHARSGAGAAKGLRHEAPPASVPARRRGGQSGLGAARRDAAETRSRGVGVELELVG